MQPRLLGFKNISGDRKGEGHLGNACYSFWQIEALGISFIIIHKSGYIKKKNENQKEAIVFQFNQCSFYGKILLSLFFLILLSSSDDFATDHHSGSSCLSCLLRIPRLTGQQLQRPLLFA